MLNMYTENREWKIKGKLGVAKRKMKYSCCEEYYPGELNLVPVNFSMKLLIKPPMG